MGDARASQAAALIWDNWRNRSRIAALPESCRPRTVAEGYAAQAELSALSGWQAGGWKIAATSAAGQKHIGVAGPLAGRLLDGKLHESGAELACAQLHMAVVEAEFVFRLAEDLPPRGQDYSPADVVAAESWRDLDLAAHRASLTITGETAVEGIGANVLGDPRRALAWLANDRIIQGAPLRAGEIITTGTCIVPAAIKPGDDVVADFGVMGRVSVRFAA